MACGYVISDTRQSRATLLPIKVACLTSRVAQLLTSRATKLLDRNHLYSSAISHSVAELWLVSCLFTCPWISLSLCNIHLTPLIERWSNQQSTTDNYVVVCITRSHVCLAIVCRQKTNSCLGNLATKLRDKVAGLCCMSDMGLIEECWCVACVIVLIDDRFCLCSFRLWL